MKMQTRFQFLFLAASLTGLTACGGGNSKLPISFSSSAQLAEERFLTNDEINIAARICYAYQSKSVNFRTSAYLNKSFTFQAQKTDCSSSTFSYNLSAVLRYDNSNNLIFALSSGVDPSLQFNKKVQTDTSGYLAQLCTRIKNNDTKTISNTSTANGVKTQITFQHDSFDSYLLMYFVLQPDGTYKIDSGEKFQVRTQFNFTTGQILGMDEIYSNQRVCSTLDKVKNSNFEQRFSTFQ